MYGELAPGEYRIGKSVLDLRGSGDFDKYMVYAHFILNGFPGLMSLKNGLAGEKIEKSDKIRQNTEKISGKM